MMPSLAVTAPVLAMTWGPITFGAPLVAWGALACAVPVLIHLVLRQRPRRQVFPAMRFLMQSHQSSTRAHRLKHLLLLLCRVMIVLTLVAMLMRTTCAPGGAAATGGWLSPGSTPVSAVICLDDSASMGYRFQGRTRLQHALQWARNLLEDASLCPGGSEAAIITGSAYPQDGVWTQDLPAAGKRLEALPVASHDRPVAALLDGAFRLLSDARHPRREVYLFTNLTRHGWREPPPSAPGYLTRLYVLDVGQEEDHNVALSWPTVPDHVLPAGLPATLTVRVRSGDPAAEPVLELAVDGQPRGRQTAGVLTPNTEVEVALALPALAKGVHAVTIDLQPADALACDNRRFACVSVGDLPRVLIAGGEGGNEVGTLLSAMIAPAAQPAGQHRFDVHHVPAPRLAETDLGGLLAVILADNDTLSPEAWAVLNRYVEAGGSLLIVPGPNTRLQAFEHAGAMLPAPVESIAQCPEPITIAATELTHPFLRPFADPAVDSINDRRVFSRLNLGAPRENATVVAPFSDHRPALVESRAGRGRVILLAFSPAREWGQFGTQAAPMIVLLHTILDELSPPARDIAQFVAGQVAFHLVPDLAGARFYLADATAGPAKSLSAADGRIRLPTGATGTYRLSADPEGAAPLLHYSVNVAEGESDAERISPSAVESLFPPGVAVVADDPDRLARAAGQSKKATEMLVPLALVLLGLLFAESLFANRFYGFRAGSDSAA